MQTPSSASSPQSDPEQVSQATRLFQRRDLQLPAITIAFHDSEQPCHGHVGYFRPNPHRIDICSDLPFVLIHELAHAWIHDNVNSATRIAFVQRNGLHSWNDPNHEWGQRGVEVAAFTMQQVVMRELDPRSRRNQELLTNYDLLTTPTPSPASLRWTNSDPSPLLRRALQHP